MKKVPLRMCVCCRQMFEKTSLQRVVKTTDGSFVVDKTGRLPGRGAYVCFSAECHKNAVKKRALNKAFKCDVGVDVYAALEVKDVSAEGALSDKSVTENTSQTESNASNKTVGTAASKTSNKTAGTVKNDG